MLKIFTHLKKKQNDTQITRYHDSFIHYFVCPSVCPSIRSFIIICNVFFIFFFREQPSRLIDDDPLRIPPRRPADFHGEW